MEMRLTRKSITMQLREHCEANGLTYEARCEGAGPLRIIINGEALSPGDACDKYLPGGFKGAYGKGFGR